MEAEKILVAVDMTEEAAHVLEEGLRTARAFGADLLLVHVVHRLDSLYGIYLGGGSVAALQGDLEQSAREQLARLYKEHVAASGVACQDMVLTGPPWREIVGCAMHFGVKRIILGAHVGSKPEHKMLGSTAMRVVRHAPCPVLIVPPALPAAG